MFVLKVQQNCLLKDCLYSRFQLLNFVSKLRHKPIANVRHNHISNIEWQNRKFVFEISQKEGKVLIMTVVNKRSVIGCT